MPSRIDRQRLSDAYAANRASLYQLCRRMLRRPEDAEDAVQEAFARAAGPILRGECDPAPYLYVTARHVCLNALQARRRLDVELQPQLPGADAGPEQIAVQRQLLHSAWSALSARERQLLAQSFAGYAYQEMAHRTGMTAKSVSVGLCRARGRARRAVENSAGAMLWLRNLPRRLHRAMVTRRLAHLVLPGNGAAEFGALAVSVVLLGAAPAVPQATGAGAGARPHPAVVNAIQAVDRASGDGASERSLAQLPTTPPGVASGTRPQRASAAPLPPGIPRPADLAASVAGPHMSTVAASPDYAQDHTLFAGGRLPVCSTCGVLFESVDGGAHWTQRKAVGYQGDALSFSPWWPSDRRLSSGTPVGLEESDDDGATFTLVAPIPGPIAVQPNAMGGGERVVIASHSLLWSYDTASRSLAQLAVLPPEFLPSSVLVGGGNGQVLVGGFRYAALQIDAVLLRCTLAGACQTVATIPGGGGATLVSSAAAPGEVALITDQGDVYTSADGGASFVRMDTGGQHACAVAVGSVAGVARVTMSYETPLDSASGGLRNGLASATSRSAHFVASPAGVPAFGVGPILTLPGGRILALQTQGATSPLVWYSDDAGSTWHHSDT